MTRKISAAARLLICVLMVISIAIPTGSYFAKAEADGPSTGVSDSDGTSGSDGTASDGDAEEEDSLYDSVTVSGDIASIKTKVNYNQTEARSTLALINAFRTSTSGADAPGGAWYWAENNTDKVVLNTDDSNTLKPLVYDYDLEKAAMQRAAEIALRIDQTHTRPDGRSAITVLEDLGIIADYSAYGENMAAAVYSSAEGFFFILREDDSPYKCQGHRRNMLKPEFTSVGIACVRINGCSFYVQEFGTTAKTTAETSPSDVLEKVDIDVLTENLIYYGTAVTSCDDTMPIGTTQDAPAAVVYFATSPTDASVSPSDIFFGNGLPVLMELKWTSAAPAVVDVVNNSIIAKSAGEAVLSAELEPVVSPGDVPLSFTLPITVEPVDLSKATINLEYDETEYTGEIKEPRITSVTIDGHALTLSNDNCTIVYENNKNPGTAKVTITGKGDYKGTVSKSFTIKECTHVFDEGTVVSNADCVKDGQKKLECTKCDYSKTEAIKATGHTPGAAATCTTDQTCTVCNAVIKEKLGHTPASGKFDCTKDQYCSVCKAAYHKAGSHTAGPEATCTTDQTCTVCSAVIKEKTGHTAGAEATCTTDQICTVCKTVLKEKTGHTPGAAATCTTDQKCTVCQAVIKDATGHTPGDKATCTTDQKCSDCNAILTLATGHTPGAAATCTTDQKCTVCNAVIKKATGHTPGAAATCSTAQSCKVCGAVVQKATGNHVDTNTKDGKCDVCGADVTGKGPGTGEIIRSNLPVIIASAAVLASIIAIVVVMIKKHKDGING